MKVARGFTVIEMLIAVSMLLTVAYFVAPFFFADAPKQSLDRYAAEAMDALREAQASIMSGRNNARYGVHFEADKLVLFQGAAYSPSDANNVAHQFSGAAGSSGFVSIAGVSLAPGGACAVSTGTGNCDVHFASWRGTPNETGSVTFSANDGSTRVVSINAAGMIDAQ